jgi:hypothetical protein
MAVILQLLAEALPSRAFEARMNQPYVRMRCAESEAYRACIYLTAI